MFGVDVFNIIDNVVENGFAQQFILASEEPEEELQDTGGLDQTLVPQHDQRLDKSLQVKHISLLINNLFNNNINKDIYMAQILKRF